MMLWSPLLRHTLFATLFALAALLSRPAHAVDDPELDYYTLTTPNFYVHYHSGLEDLARRVAQIAEEAHVLLVPRLGWNPRERTHVNVVDKLDSANGWARVYGRNLFTVYGMAPEADGVLGYYDDWLRILVFHEYVHILHLDTNPGLPRLLNRFVGKQVHPNQVLPRWYTEGIATYFESAATGTGRIHSSLFQMWVRAAALEDRLFDLGQSSGLPVSWPSGSAAYLYGGFFIDYIARAHGEQFVRDFNHVYGERVVPFGLNRAAREVSDKSFERWWQEWTAEARARAQARRVAVRAVGETPLEYLTHDGGYTGYPTLRPGHGQITFYDAGQTSHPAYAALAPSGRVERLFDVRSAAGPASWSADGEALYYSRSTVTRGVYSFQDLFVYDAIRGAHRRLTRAERAREPAASPDGASLVYVRNRGGTMELVHRRFDAFDAPEVLVSGLDHPGDAEARWQQIGTPTFTPDGRGVVFSWWRLDARQRDLWLYDFDAPAGERLRRLTDSPAQELGPRFGPDGLLYYSSDHSGIFNIYAMDLASGEVFQVSNVVNGVFAPQPSADGQWIYVASYTANGYELARFRRPTRLRGRVERADLTEARLSRRGVYPDLGHLALELTPRPYRPVRWLAPLTLMPDFGLLQSGAGLGATLAGEDPVGNHSYIVSGGFTTGPEFTDRAANLGFSYGYGGLPFDLSLTARLANLPRTRGLVAESRNVPYHERQYLGRVTASLPIRLVTHTLSLSTSFKAEHTSMHERPQVRHEPGDVRPVDPQQGWFNEVSFSVSAASTERYALSVSTERGLSGWLSLGLQNRAIGSPSDLVTLSYGFDAYTPNPLARRHVFAMQLRGAITSSGLGPDRQFTIGGTAPQDVLTSLIFQDPRSGFPLRGYPPGLMRGSQYQIWKFEYRFSLLDLDRGFSTLPVFLRQIKGSLFADTGAAYNGYLADASFRTGIGGELQLDALLGYHLFNTLRLGYARGLNEEGISEWYMLFGGGF